MGIELELFPDLFLGLNITRDLVAGTVSVSQRSYITSVAKEYGMENSNKVSTPFNEKTEILRATDQEVEDARHLDYRTFLGKLMFVAVGSRPDISATITLLASHTARPSEAHYVALKHLLRYLVGTRNRSIVYSRDFPLVPRYFADANWGGEFTKRRSTTGALVMMAGAPVAWRSKLQVVVAQSSTEAEYYALTDIAKTILWHRQLLPFFHIPQLLPSLIFADNLSAIRLAKDSVDHQRSRHIDIKHHFIRDHYEKKEIDFKYVGTKDNAADILTKTLGTNLHSRSVGALGLRDMET